MAGLIFGSIFIAIGAACNDLKDTQSMVTPAMVLVMLPMFTWMSVLRAPDGMIAIGAVALPDRGAVPDDAAHLAAARTAGVADRACRSLLMAATVVLAIWAAGKIFRTGLLMQGKSATMAEMVRWVRAK